MSLNERNHTLVMFAEAFLEAENPMENITDPDLLQKKQVFAHAFVLSLVQRVEDNLDFNAGLFPGGNISQLWFYNQDRVFAHPDEGFIAVWRHAHETKYHTGVVVEVCDSGSFETVEAGLLPFDGQHILVKNDYVYRKKRFTKGIMDYHLMGFIDPFFFKYMEVN